MSTNGMHHTAKEQKTEDSTKVGNTVREEEKDAKEEKGKREAEEINISSLHPARPFMEPLSAVRSAPQSMHALLQTLFTSLRPLLDVHPPSAPTTTAYLSEAHTTRKANAGGDSLPHHVECCGHLSPVSACATCMANQHIALKETVKEVQKETEKKFHQLTPEEQEPLLGKEDAVDDLTSSSTSSPPALATDDTSSALEDVMILGSRMVWLYKDEASRRTALHRLISPVGRQILERYLKFVK